MGEPPTNTRWDRRYRLERWKVSPHSFEWIALAAVVAVTLTIVSGAAVRLTGSGLGCNTWPGCDRTSVVAPLEAHAWIEFGNRLINAAVSVAAVGGFVAALRRRPRRRDLTWLAGGLLIGLLVEVAIGALVVYSGLTPTLVSLHFLLGLAFLAEAVVLHQRSKLPDCAGAGRPMVSRTQIRLGRLSLLALVVVACLGTVVTSTGPHGGAPNDPRYHFSLHAVAQLHGAAAEVFLAITILMLWSLARTGAPAAVIRRAQMMLAALVLQAVVGYAQYLSGDPVAVVAVHVAGASVLVIATLRFYLGLWDHTVGAGTEEAGAQPERGSASPAAAGRPAAPATAATAAAPVPAVGR